ncbi:chorismate mutase, partial [filamentous cyanobacterium CCT1]
ENTAPAMEAAVVELLDALEALNQIDPAWIISATFSVTRDLDALFPAAIARRRPRWNEVALLDVQHMHVEGSLPRCIRMLIHIQLPKSHPQPQHIYMREAQTLRPDWSLASLP